MVQVDIVIGNQELQCLIAKCVFLSDDLIEWVFNFYNEDMILIKTLVHPDRCPDIPDDAA